MLCVLKIIQIVLVIPQALSLLKKEGFSAGIKKIWPYLHGEKITVDLSDETSENKEYKKIIYCCQGQRNKGGIHYLEIPKYLQYAFGYETAVVIFKHLYYSRVLVFFRFLKFFSQSSEISRSQIEFIRRLKALHYNLAICDAAISPKFLKLLSDENIRTLLIINEEDVGKVSDFVIKPPKTTAITADYVAEMLTLLTQAKDVHVLIPENEVLNQIEIINRPFQKSGEVAIILHLYYDEMWEEICGFLDHFPVPFDLHISLKTNVSQQVVQTIHARFPHARLHIFENRGRDVAPFLSILARILPLGYKYVCKIHTKHSPHFVDGSGKSWRTRVLNELLGSSATVSRILNYFEQHSDTGIIAPKGYLYRYDEPFDMNTAWVSHFARQLDIDMPKKFFYAAGTMFWFKPAALSRLTELQLHPADFPAETDPKISLVDGSMAHALERVIALCAVASGYKVRDTRIIQKK